jgi:hypothetical protein
MSKMTATERAVIDAFNEAESSSDVYFSAGQHRIKLMEYFWVNAADDPEAEKTTVGPGFKFEVLESTNPKHPAGQEVVRIINLNPTSAMKSSRAAALSAAKSEIKTIYESLFVAKGVDPGEIPFAEIAEDLPNAAKQNKTFVGCELLCEGVNAINRKTKQPVVDLAGNPYVNTTFYPAVDAL